MINEFAQNLSRPVKTAGPVSAAANLGLPGGTVGKVLERFRRLLAEIDRNRSIEYENRKTIAHLRSLSDSQLRDIGITRSGIERAVRHGKESI